MKKEKRIELPTSGYLYLFEGVIQTCGPMDVARLDPPVAEDGRRLSREHNIPRYRAEQSMGRKYAKGGVHHRKEQLRSTF